MSIRTAVRVAALASWSLLAACSTAAPVRIPAGQSYIAEKKSFDGDLKAFASQVTIDTILSHPGAKLVSSVPFPGCEGNAGLMTLDLPKSSPPSVLLLGFTVRNFSSVTASYTRPRGAAADPAVTTAMHSVICQV